MIRRSRPGKTVLKTRSVCLFNARPRSFVAERWAGGFSAGQLHTMPTLRSASAVETQEMSGGSDQTSSHRLIKRKMICKYTISFSDRNKHNNQTACEFVFLHVAVRRIGRCPPAPEYPSPYSSSPLVGSEAMSFHTPHIAQTAQRCSKMPQSRDSFKLSQRGTDCHTHVYPTPPLPHTTDHAG